MAIGDNRLPEGTDSIIEGAGTDGGPEFGTGFTPSTGALDGPMTAPAPAAGTGPALSGGGDGVRATLEDAKARVSEKTADLRTQATDKVNAYALQGKDRAVEGLDTVQRMIGEAADTIDAKVGSQYGDYVRQAATGVAGLADTLRTKDVGELIDDTRELVRKSPAIAIGAAAAIGFALTRIVKAGLDAGTGTTTTPADTMGSGPAGGPAA